MSIRPSFPAQITDNTPAGNSHYELIKDKIPAWMLTASSATHANLRNSDLDSAPWLATARETDAQTLEQLHKAYVRHRRHEQKIHRILAKLPAIEAYAEPLLKAKLLERFGLDIDVRNSYLFHARRVAIDATFLTASTDPVVKAATAIKAATQSLLACALQNFEAWETEPGAMTDDRGRTAVASRLYHAEPAPHRPGLPPRQSALAIVPEQFAALCRELDLGGTYQQLIHNVFNPVSRAGDSEDAATTNLRAEFKQFEHSAFLLQVHIARLKQLISPALQGTLINIARNKPTTLDGVAVTRNFLTLWDVELSAIVVFGKDRSASPRSEKVVVYIPDDPYEPLREYASLAHFFASLRDSFLKPGYQQFFARFIPARHRARLFARLHQAIYPKVWNSAGYYQEQLDRNANLHLREGTFFGNLLNALYQQKVALLADDALFHGVPTAAEDHKSQNDKLLYFVQTTFNVLNIAAFVVPVLGQVMLAVTAVQLCSEVYEGIESLARGEQQQAWGYLMDVVENLAMIAALGSLSAASGIRAVQPPELVSQMRRVQLPDGNSRLWKADLQPFAHDVVLPADLQPNAAGLYTYQGRQWLTLEGRTYSVKPVTGTLPYRLEHPRRLNAYEPPLRHNGAGAWLQVTDQPREWEGLRLFRRLGYSGAEFSDETASTLMRVSATSPAELRHALTQSQQPPALLTDTLQRFKLEQDLDRFSRQLENGDHRADPLLQIQLLAQAPEWPANRPLTVLDKQGNRVAQYHSLSSNPPVRPLALQLDGSDVLESLLRQLNRAEQEGLLQQRLGSGETNLNTAVRELQQQVAKRAQTQKNQLFSERYQNLQKTTSEPVQQIQRVFGGLPTVAVEELIRHATPAELEQLHSDGRVPVRLAEEARAYLQKLRLNRAYEGLYLDSSLNPDSAKLLLHTLETLDGWPSDFYLQVREGSTRGPLLDSIGSPEAPIGKILVKEGTSYRTYSSDERQLHGRDNLYAAVLHALPDAQRSSLGFADVSQHVALKRAVQAQPLLARHILRRVLKIQALKPGARSPMRLADGRLGLPLSGRGRLAGFILEETLLDKIRLLELEHAYPEQILQQFYEARWSRTDINQRLDQLLAQQQVLSDHLSSWTEATLSMPPLSRERMSSRSRIADALWNHWRANSLPELRPTYTPLQMADTYLVDFPPQLPDFIVDSIEGLQLWNVNPDVRQTDPFADLINNSSRFSQFFSRFPRVRTVVFGQSLGQPRYSSAIAQALLAAYPQLRELSLIDTRLYISQSEIDFYRGFTQLRRLDLSGNTLNILGSLDFSGLNLEYLGLERSNLHGWPQWLDSNALNGIAEVSLANNQITTVPAAVLENPLGSTHHSRISLLGNELSRDTLIRLRLSEGEGRRFSFDLTISENLRTLLDVLTQERATLDENFAQWAQASHSDAPLRDEQIASRLRLGRLVHDLWSNEPTHGHVATLRLEALALSDFPRRLPAFFYHRMRSLQLLRVATHASELRQFLSDFPYLHSLRIEGHVSALGSLSTALPQLRMLEHLSLIDQGLTIDQSALTLLELMPELTELQLDRNILGEITDASTLRNIEYLSLNSVGLHAWPLWLDSLLPGPMQRLSLVDNQLRELPRHILENPRTDEHHTEISLTGNPLTDETMRTAHLSEGYNRAYDFYMDLPPEIRALERDFHDSSGSGTSSPDAAQAGVDAWLSGAEDRNELRRGIWQQVERAADAPELLGVVSHLEHSADYRDASSRTGLTERVWTVLEVAARDTELRLVLNGMAEEPLQQIRQRDTCPDGIRLAFNQMEVQVYIRQSLQGVSNERRGSSLYALTRRLYRLEALDNIAREQAGSRDEAEVRLAYRLHFAHELDLPVPPSNMLYRTAANIRPGELDTALERVHQSEGGQAFLDFARQRDFWVEYLRETHTDRFAALKTEYEAQVLELYDLYPQDNPDQIAARITALEQQFKRDESNLIEALTNLAGQQ